MLFTATGEVGEVKPVFDDAGAGRVMEFDSDRVTGALVADHPDIIRVLQVWLPEPSLPRTVALPEGKSKRPPRRDVLTCPTSTHVGYVEVGLNTEPH